jgi:RNA polymerase sigma factor (TIGR02999 family)
MSDLTNILDQVAAGDPRAADQLLPLVYDDLRRLARKRLAQERVEHTLQPTALVHEAYLQLVGARTDWQGRRHFFATAAEAMRRILVDSARRKLALKRGGDWQQQPLDDIAAPSAEEGLDVLAVHEALGALEEVDARRAALVKLRCFAGFSIEEAADLLEISRATAVKDWAFARAWLKRWLKDRD